MGADVDVVRTAFLTKDVVAGTLTSPEPPPHPAATNTPTTSRPVSRLQNPERQTLRCMPPTITQLGKRFPLRPLEVGLRHAHSAGCGSFQIVVQIRERVPERIRPTAARIVPTRGWRLPRGVVEGRGLLSGPCLLSLPGSTSSLSVVTHGGGWRLRLRGWPQWSLPRWLRMPEGP